MPTVQTAIAHVSIDWIAIALFAICCALFSLRAGIRGATALTIAAPLALLFYDMLPETAFVSVRFSALSPLLHAAVAGALFLGCATILYFACPRDMAGGTYPLQAIFSGLAPAAAFTVVWQQIPAVAALYPLSPLMQSVFGTPYALYWLLGSLFAVVMARR